MGNDRVRRIGRPLLLIGDGLGKVGLEPLLVESLIVPRTVQVPNEVVQVIHPDLVALFHSHGNEGWTDRLHVQDPKAWILSGGRLHSREAVSYTHLRAHETRHDL